MLRGTRILVVEDDEAINKVVCSYLGKQGAICTAAFSGTEGMLHLDDAVPFDLLITDLMLPGATGETLVARATEAALPVVVLSARATVADRVDLLHLGADDYLVKPFDLEELQARCEAVLRRRTAASPASAAESVAAVVGVAAGTPAANGAPAGAVGSAATGNTPVGQGPCPCRSTTADAGMAAGAETDAAATDAAARPILRFGAWELDEDARTFTAAGRSVRLTRTEYEMVRMLMAAPHRVHTKRSLSAAATGDAAALEDKTVSTHIGNIRAKLRDTGTEDYLETVWGVGFKLRDLS